MLYKANKLLKVVGNSHDAKMRAKKDVWFYIL